jgi:hypothetical protein
VTLNEEVPGVALDETLSERVEPPFEAGEITELIPLGSPETANETAPLNPLLGVTERASVPLDPGAIVIVEGATATLKSPGDVTGRQEACPSPKSMSSIG